MYKDNNNEIIESIKRNVSVMLSYGEISDIIPVGVFKISRFY